MPWHPSIYNCKANLKVFIHVLPIGRPASLCCPLTVQPPYAAPRQSGHLTTAHQLFSSPHPHLCCQLTSQPLPDPGATLPASTHAWLRDASSAARPAGSCSRASLRTRRRRWPGTWRPWCWSGTLMRCWWRPSGRGSAGKSGCCWRAGIRGSEAEHRQPPQTLRSIRPAVTQCSRGSRCRRRGCPWHISTAAAPEAPPTRSCPCCSSLEGSCQ